MNLKQSIMGLAAVSAAFGGIVWLAQLAPADKTGDAPNQNGTLIAIENDFDFGAISMAAGKVSHTFKIKNSGTEPVLIRKFYTSCMCTSAELIKGGEKFGPFGMPGHGFVPSIDETLNPGEEAEMGVVFDPAAHGPAGLGAISRVIYIESGSASPLELRFSAIVNP